MQHVHRASGLATKLKRAQPRSLAASGMGKRAAG